MTSWILELDRGKGIPHEGNYSSFLGVQEKRLKQESSEEQAQQRTIARERALDHDRYRAELVALGDEMAERGELPGVLCVEAGFRVIDGIRREHELAATRDAARAKGWRTLILCVERPGQQRTDNTEAEALRRAADLMLLNDGSLDDLRRRVDAALGLES